MGALDTVKELGRIATTATHTKDVIDLFEKKVGLLTEQVAALETENTNLKQQVENLNQELERIRPKQDRLEEGAEKILRLLFDCHRGDELHFSDVIASALRMNKGVAQYHCDVLYEAEYIGMAGFEQYYLYPKGRAYVVKYLLRT